MTSTNDAREALRKHRLSLSDHEALADAQAGCVPCKLCGGKAIISDAGVGAGYYVRCENSGAFRASQGCMVTDSRLGGWAYNVMDWWNRLHSLPAPAPAAWKYAPPNDGRCHPSEFYSTGQKIPPQGWKETPLYATPQAPATGVDATPFVHAIAEDRKRFNEGSPTWNAYSFCIAICEQVAALNPADAEGGE